MVCGIGFADGEQDCASIVSSMPQALEIVQRLFTGNGPNAQTFIVRGMHRKHRIGKAAVQEIACFTFVLSAWLRTWSYVFNFGIRSILAIRAPI